MKTKVLLLLIALAFVACKPAAQKDSNPEQTTTVSQNVKQKLQVYYFYGSHRCATCNSIEENTKKLMETNFKNEVADGSITISYLNIEDEANKSLVEKLQVYSSSLILIEYKADNVIVHDLTQYAYTYSRNQPDVFMQGVTDSIKSYIQ